MSLIGQRLSAAGIRFISCKATHEPGISRIDAIVCETQADTLAANAWLATNGFTARASVGTAEEIADWKRWQE